MNLLFAITIGVVVAVAVLQLVQRDVVRVVVGLYLLWNAVNLLIIGVATLRATRAPLADGDGGALADPLVQAIVLTSIVITFGFTAFLLTLLVLLGHRGKSFDVEEFDKGRA